MYIIDLFNNIISNGSILLSGVLFGSYIFETCLLNCKIYKYKFQVISLFTIYLFYKLKRNK